MDLTTTGWNTYFQHHFQAFTAQAYLPARVVFAHKELYRLISEQGEFLAEVSGKFRHQTAGNGDFPVVGDWVAMTPHSENNALIQAVLPRRTAISRKEAGGVIREQVIAANVDTLFIVTALDGYRGVNVRRIERYLTQVYNTGARPVILLNKADTCLDVGAAIAEVEAVTYGVPVHAISAKEHQGLNVLQPYLNPGVTVALIGTSGVGKSTLINALLGEDRQRVNIISDTTGKGLHTTTHRELLMLPGGGMLIDNPGMRELQLWGDEEDVDDAFGDIEALAAGCRFRDCQHHNEPGCAVRQAIATGELDQNRYQNYLKMKKELRFLERRRDTSAEHVERQRGKQFARMVRQHKEKRVVY